VYFLALVMTFLFNKKLIYIDPPYNTGNDSFNYNDNFNHSTWLTFMKNRLEVARDLLSEDGVIFVQCDDNEQAYLKVLMDEIFERDNFVNNIIWHKKNVVQNDAKYFNENHDHILVFCKIKTHWKPNLLKRTKEMDARYSNPDNDPKGKWTSVALQAKSGTKDNVYKIEFPNGVEWSPVEGTYPRLNKQSLQLAYDENRLWFGKTGTNIPRLKKYLNEVKKGLISNTIFANESSGSTQQGKEELKKILKQNIFTTPKPEKLLEKIIQIATKKGDLVLDYHLGSGTTCAVAHKMGRQYIGIEQMDYIEDVAVKRMQKVIGTTVKKDGELLESLDFDSGGPRYNPFVQCQCIAVPFCGQRLGGNQALGRLFWWLFE
jgi:adenine-specific DNA-methyltransferase